MSTVGIPEAGGGGFHIPPGTFNRPPGGPPAYAGNPAGGPAGSGTPVNNPYSMGQEVAPGETIVAQQYDQDRHIWINMTSKGGIYTSSGQTLPGQGSYLGYAAGTANPGVEAALHGNFGAGGLSLMAGGGYTETNINGEKYNFGWPLNGGPGSSSNPGGPLPPQMNATQQSAWAILQQTLQSYGFTGSDLASLTKFVQTELINGTGADQISLDLQNSREYAKRFPAIIQRRQAGLPPISAGEYVSLERQYAQLERAAGLPVNFTDQSHYDSLIARDVSSSEYSSRINDGYVAMLQAPAEARQALKDYYGVTDGHLAAYFLDPNKALPLLKQQAQAALIGGAGIRSGFGEVSQGQAARVAQLGVSSDAAQTGFMELFHERQLTHTLPGQAQTAISADQQLGAAFGGDEATRELLQRRADEQKATFQAGGKFGEDQAGIAGIGQVVR